MPFARIVETYIQDQRESLVNVGPRDEKGSNSPESPKRLSVGNPDKSNSATKPRMSISNCACLCGIFIAAEGC